MARRCDGAGALHVALHDPARVLREVEAKRDMLARHVLSPATGDPNYRGKTAMTASTTARPGHAMTCSASRHLTPITRSTPDTPKAESVYGRAQLHSAPRPNLDFPLPDLNHLPELNRSRGHPIGFSMDGSNKATGNFAALHQTPNRAMFDDSSSPSPQQLNSHAPSRWMPDASLITLRRQPTGAGERGALWIVILKSCWGS
ncbi:DUF6221 family protein [Streptomyces vinaceus]|uniref:DUF6221 family protein n=1 Tax=Streptomyces vinaceus TaxID=1960 RepID=UPI0035DA9D02